MMKGIELNIEGQCIRGAIEHGSIHLILVADKKGICLHFRGATIDKQIIWYKKELQENESCEISIVDICTNSVPMEVKEISNAELLNYYYSLKERLIQKNLLVDYDRN